MTENKKCSCGSSIFTYTKSIVAKQDYNTETRHWDILEYIGSNEIIVSVNCENCGAEHDELIDTPAGEVDPTVNVTDQIMTIVKRGGPSARQKLLELMEQMGFKS